MYHYAGNNPVKYTDPTGEFAQAVIGALVGAVTGAATNAVVQTVSNLCSGQDIKTAVSNIDLKSVGAAALGGAVTGALSGGLKAVKDVGEAVRLYKSASALLNTSSNIAGTAVSTIADNLLHGENITQNLGENIAIAGVAGVVTGAATKTGSKLIDTNSNGIKESSIVYMKEISNSGLSTMTTVAPNETFKELSIGFIQEISSTQNEAE